LVITIDVDDAGHVNANTSWQGNGASPTDVGTAASAATWAAKSFVQGAAASYLSAGGPGSAVELIAAFEQAPLSLSRESVWCDVRERPVDP
jgi:hypothetical protein